MDFFAKAAGQGLVFVDPRDDDDGDVFAERGFAQRSAKGKAIHRRHEKVGDDEIRALRDKHGQSLLPARRLDDARFEDGEPGIAADEPLHPLACDGIVFDDKDLLFHHSIGVDITAPRREPWLSCWRRSNIRILFVSCRDGRSARLHAFEFFARIGCCSGEGGPVGHRRKSHLGLQLGQGIVGAHAARFEGLELL